MARRIQFAEGEYYHVYNRGTEKRKIFMDEKDYERFIRLLYGANSHTSIHLSNYQGSTLLEIPRGEPLVDIGAWCLIPNHFHLLLKERCINGLSRFLQKLLTGYTMYFNAKYNRKGVLFESSFQAQHLDTDNYLKYQYTYIHLNPISLVEANWKDKKISDLKKTREFLFLYPYSSFHDYLGTLRAEGMILNREAFPEYFRTFIDFKNMVDEWMSFSKKAPNLL
ncbi:hypothetical protein A3I25_02680 [Candidatus Nomurabacteria bacterium RIFCSPLOWO2_02_FULL_42_17]|uniref:Transposase IS200-like domain-containing protein n=1 Tax=Candidatus Nomurabacteria bacterium RIFCSPLOWO2_02_FULL_42_17 TaxID=1801789 RepID=A0A1F6XPK1_9BACT|nr:MAG: Transposase [Parcubacteria group bacterium GW2011_GWA2_42_18]OGI96076.1 MAG: hypothetical protein A3I25_02680 [Candidatus Nomurabacteria bacterium RIFCSPLOWO2_02_FULL_42_17]